MTSYGDYLARASLSETMLLIRPLRTEIAESIMKHRAVSSAGATLKLPTEKQTFPNTDYLKIATDGTIIFRNSKYGQIIVLEPSFSTDSVTWKCVGSKPEKNIPQDCR